MNSPVKITQFRGINNRLSLERLRPMGDVGPGRFVPDAVNVDLTDAGSFQCRPGYTRIGTDELCRGLVGQGMHGYYAAGTDLKLLDVAGNSRVIGSVASAHAPVCSAVTPLGVVMSDTFSLQLLVGDQVSRLAPPAPNPLPGVAATNGTLIAGAYGVLFVHEDAAGRRSAPTMPVYVSLPANAGLTVTSAARPYTLGVYVSSPDGDVFYRAGQLAPSATTLIVSSVALDGEAMMFEPMDLLPAGDVLCYHKGRLYSAVDGMLCYSQPYQFGLFRPAADFVSFDMPVAVMASVDEGLFIATTTQSRLRRTRRRVASRA